MIDDLHSESLGLLLQVPSNSTHPQHTEDFPFGIMAQNRSRLAAPFPFAEGKHAGIEIPERTDDQEHVYVCGGIVDGCWDVGNAHGRRLETAGVDVYLVVAGAWDRCQ